MNPFRNIKVGVLGDIIADAYVYGKQHKLSREAPIVVAKYEGEDTLLGGAGNVINNLASLGAEVRPIGVLGVDEMGRSLKSWFEYFSIDIDGIIFTNERITPTKTRYLVGDIHTTKRQIVRFDRLPKEPVLEKIENQLMEQMKRLDKVVDIWIISDYGCGILSPRIISMLPYTLTKKIIVDSRHNLKKFQGVTYLTPNASELEEATDSKLTSTKSLINAATQLIQEVQTEGILVTQGSNGMTFCNKNGSYTKIPPYNTNEIVDVTGAGDTVASMFALGLAAGFTPVEAAKLANYGASIVIMKSGPATVREEELTHYKI